MPPTPPSLRIAALRRITSRPLLPPRFSSSFLRRQVSSSPYLLKSKPVQDATPKHQPPPRPSDPASAPAQAPPTDLSQLDVLGNTPIPATSVDICHADGFSLNSGVHITGGSGALLIGGEAFEWRPWGSKQMRLINDKGQWEIEESAWGVFGVVWPRPGK